MLVTALVVGQTQAAECLLDHGADPEMEDMFKATCIMRVVDSGNMAGLKFLWDKVDRHIQDAFSRTILHSAAMNNRVAALQFILDNDASLDVNAQDNDGVVPLHDVVKHGDHMNTAKLLLDHGASPHIQNNKGESPLDVARYYGRKRVLTLFGRGDSFSRLKIPDKISQEMLMGAISRNDSDETTLTYLQHFNGKLRDACNLVELTPGSVPGIQPDNPLDKAIYARKLRCAEFLIQQGANVNGKNRFKETPLHQAAKYGDVKLAKLLIERGARVNVQNGSGSTPIIDAIYAGSLDVAIVLLENGDSWTAKSVDTASKVILVGKACELGSKIAVERLVAAGVSLSTKDKEGLTPRQRALEKNYHEIVAYLDGIP
jgi:ankyrin